MLAELQTAFRAALLDRAEPTPASLKSHNTHRPDRRYAVYRNTVLFNLIEALQSRFPVAARVTGDEFFREIARRFALLSPPRSPVLLTYGDDLPDFVERLDGIGDLAYLPDVLRLERAWSQSYHAADAASAPADALAALAPETLGDTRVALHPAVRLLRSAFPVVTIWAMNQDGAEVRPIVDWSGEDALVVRPSLAVDIIRLPPGGFAFLASLQGGATLGDAVDAAFAEGR